MKKMNDITAEVASPEKRKTLFLTPLFMDI